MAEGEKELEAACLSRELEWIETELTASPGLLAVSNEYCLRFCRVTEWYAGSWQVPLPLLHVLKNAICSFTKARPHLAAECEHIQYVLSRLALSCFEVLLYFTDDEQSKEYWEDFLKSIQECHNVLQNDINAEFDVLIKMSKNGGPWQNPVLQSIVNQKSVTQESVTEYLSSESPVFLEYRVKYLMKYEHITEAMTLTKYCVNHPQIGENKYFLHLFLSWLCRSSPEEVLLQEIARIDCKEALDVICKLDSEEEVELSWILCVAFLTQQLRKGDMYCTRELILVWSKLQLKIDSSKKHFLEKCHHLLLTSKNVNHIFLFIRVIQNEIGVEGLQFCVELCARALRMDYQDEPNTKTLVCKTLSYLLPNDLDFCRACTLTVFFFERTLESFNAIENLYSQPDELRTEDANLVPSFLRCELLLVLKTTWPFDPEFWDWRILKKNCLALMSGKLQPSEDCLLGKEHLKCTEANGKTKSRSKEKPCKKLQTSQGTLKTESHITPMHRCVLCKKEFLGGHIVRHAQVHQQRGAFTCLICARKFRLKGQMLKHLKTHVMKIRKQELAAHTDAQKDTCNVSNGLQEACTVINGILDGSNENKNILPVSASGDEEIDCKKLTGDEVDRGSVGDTPAEPQCTAGPDVIQSEPSKTQKFSSKEADAQVDNNAEAGSIGADRADAAEAGGIGADWAEADSAGAIQANDAEAGNIAADGAEAGDIGDSVAGADCTGTSGIVAGGAGSDGAEAGSAGVDGAEACAIGAENCGIVADACGNGADGAGVSGTGADGAGVSGTGADGAGVSGTGADGAGTSGIGADGAGASGIGAVGAGASDIGADGAGASGTGADGAEASGIGADGAEAGSIAADGAEAGSITADAVPSELGAILPKKKRKNRVMKQSSLEHKKNGALCAQEEVQQDRCSLKGKPTDALGNEGSLSCPGHGCSKVFTKIQFLTKHARKVHSADENVQDYLMKWYKGKCRYCQRKFVYSQHLIDHLKRHVYPKLYFCLQYGCNQRFKSASELLTHTKGHEGFQAQCSFRDCDKVFDKLDVLYEHEAQHYISRKPICFADCDKRIFQANSEASLKPKANEGKHLPSEQNPVELLVPSWKSRKDFSEPKTYLHSMVSKQSANGILSDPLQVSVESDQKGSSVKSDSTNCHINNEQIVNGHSELKEPSCESNMDSFYSGDVSSDGNADSNKPSLSTDVLREALTSATLHNCVSKDALREEAKTVSQRDNVPPVLQSSTNQEQNATVGKRKESGTQPKYCRPQPPSYLDERYISMPKRRKLSTDSSHPPSSQENTVGMKSERHICRKCFMIFNSTEALERHNSLKNCRPLFVMESDGDESD